MRRSRSSAGRFHRERRLCSRAWTRRRSGGAAAVEVIDAEMYKLGGDVTRRPVAEVMGELEAAEEAADVAARQARRELHEKRKAEVQANVDERVGKLKEKLHVSSRAYR